MSRKLWLLVLVVVALSLALGACAPAAAPSAAKDKVTLQSKWVPQAQFAGYYAAKEKGYYDAENLDVTIRPGGPDIIPEQVVASGQAQFGIDWLPSLLSSREQGTPLVNIGQVFQKSGMLSIRWKETKLTGVPDYKGKKVAQWLGGNEFELYATLAKYNLDPKKDLEIVAQPFDMNLLLQKQVVAAAAMTYNEYAQVLEVKNPATGNLYQPADLEIVDFNNEGTAMLEDGVFTTEAFLKDAKNQDIATRFLKASFRGWMYCRDNVSDCVDIVLKQGPTLPKGHQTWQMNEINKLVWPSPNGIGVMDDNLYKQTADIALKYGVIKKAAGKEAYVTDYAKKAVDALKDQDTKGANYKPASVTLTEGGK
jgi:NitT/TauT family transport system substrate-binding protein